MSAVDSLGIVGSTVDQIRIDACVDPGGGFGIVYRGYHLGRGEAVAMKCLRLTRLTNLSEPARAAIVKRFREETGILHRLSHGTHDIVRCISSGQLFAPATGEPVPYMVLEWLDGRTLSADLADRREHGLPGRSLRETLDLIESAALAIAHAHTQGIIHRDIKPANLLLTHVRGGLRLKVLDFGLAKILSDDRRPGSNVSTADGVQLFSVGYCAPEQLSSTVGEIGPWTDIYSLALVMLEVMRGEKVRHPTQGSLRASALGITLPGPVEDLLARAVAPSPLERPADANAFWSALRELARRSSTPVRDASALAATAYDGDVAAAIRRVRAATASPSSPAHEASPFTGTMVMVNAPNGALHVLTPHAAGDARAPGSIAPGPGSTAPLALPMTAPATRPEHLVTVGIAQPPSPLASSLGVGVTSPVAQVRPGSVPPSIAASAGGAPLSVDGDGLRPPRPQPLIVPRDPRDAQEPLPHATRQRAPSVPSVPPPALPTGSSSSSSAVIGVLVVLVLAVAITAAVLLLRAP